MCVWWHVVASAHAHSCCHCNPQLWSDNYFLATPHRVLLTTGAQSARPRYSVPFFFEPRLSARVAPVCLPPARRRERDAAAHREMQRLRAAHPQHGREARHSDGSGDTATRSARQRAGTTPAVPSFDSQASVVPHARAPRRMRPTDPVTYGEHMLRAFQKSFPRSSP